MLEPIGSLELPNGVKLVAMTDGLALVVVGTCVPGPLERRCEGRLHLIRLTDPARPVLAGIWDVEAGPETIVDLIAAGSRAYVAVQRTGPYGDLSQPDTRVEVLDLADPAAPRRLAVMTSASRLPHAQLRLHGDTLYWLRYAGSDVTAPGLAIYDVADAAQPRLLDTRPIAGMGLAFLGNLMFVTRLGRYAGDEIEDGLRVFDVSEPAAPLLRSQAPGDFSAVEAAGDRIYTKSNPCIQQSPEISRCYSVLVAHEVDGGGARVEATWKGFSREWVVISDLAHAGNDLLVASRDLFRKPPDPVEPSLLLDGVALAPDVPGGGGAAAVAALGDLVVVAAFTTWNGPSRVVVARWKVEGRVFLPLAVSHR